MRPDVVGRSPIFTDKLVRQAFAYLLPIDDALDKLSSGSAKRVASPISINKPEYKDDLVPYPFDVAKGVALLEESGWHDHDGDGIRDKTINGEQCGLKSRFLYSE